MRNEARSSRALSSHRPARLSLESLEDRRVLATVINVDTTADVVNGGDGLTSLREAIITANANSGDYEIQLGSGTYALSIQGILEDDSAEGDLDIDDNGTISILGAGQAQTFIQPAEAFGDRIFDIQPGATLILDGMTLTGGTAPVGMYGEAEISGGAIRCISGTLTITDCAFTGNLALATGAFGGAIYQLGPNSETAISGSTFSSNEAANNGGAIANDADTSAATTSVSVSDSTFSNNESSTRGGAIWNDGTLTTEDSYFLQNHASTFGGAITMGPMSCTTILSTTFSENFATFAGALHADGTLNICRSTFVGNQALGTSALNDGFGGGAILVAASIISIKDSTFSENSSGFSGGAITFTQSAVVTMTNCTLSGNSARKAGGGIYATSAADLEITHSTITGNRAAANGVMDDKDYGGGIALQGDGDAITLQNTIVAGNFRGTGSSASDIEEYNNASIDISTNGVYNLIGDSSTAAGLSNGVDGNIVGVNVADVLNTTLASNGGPTQTHALIVGGPAINAGDPAFVAPPTNDQRGDGYPRVLGGRLDIGAYEYLFQSTIDGRHIFYNQSGFDGNDADANEDDNDAIATDKSAYLPGDGLFPVSATTSYLRGINGIMVDLDGTHSTLTVDDFEFHISNQGVGANGANNTPTTWNSAPAPAEVVVLPDTPTTGVDRVLITWASGSIENRYLEVRVLGNDAAGGNNTNTGLDETDIFYFGNQIGDTFTNTPATVFQTSSADEIEIRGYFLAPAPITDIYDIDRNKIAGAAADEIAARGNFGVLTRINIGSPPSAPEGAPASAPGDGAGGSPLASALPSALALHSVTVVPASTPLAAPPAQAASPIVSRIATPGPTLKAATPAALSLAARESLVLHLAFDDEFLDSLDDELELGELA